MQSVESLWDGLSDTSKMRVALYTMIVAGILAAALGAYAVIERQNTLDGLWDACGFGCFRQPYPRCQPECYSFYSEPRQRTYMYRTVWPQQSEEDRLLVPPYRMLYSGHVLEYNLTEEEMKYVLVP